MPTNYTQTGPYRYDYAIAGIPFLSAASEQYPYTRQTAQNRREQINTSRDVGEQSLDGWWYRSQSSFHMGAGLKYFDTISAESASMRFEDSAGVDVWTPGEVTHLRGTSKTLTAASGFATSFATEGIANGEDGYVYADRTSDTIRWKNINGATLSYPFTGENVLDATDDGVNVYVLTTTGVYRFSNLLASPPSAPVKIYNRTTFTRGRINFIKDRLMIIANRNVYAVGANPPGSLPKTLGGVDDTGPYKAIYQLPEGYRGWEFADGPNAIYLLAGSEEATFVYAFTLKNDDTAGLNDPITVLEAPRGEQFQSMISYIGTYLILGTSLGVRVGIIAGDSSVVMGPLTVKSDGPVRALFSMRDFVWAGGANVDGKYGLYRINLSTPLEADNLLFPYAKDIATDVAWSGSRQDYIQSITRFGKSDRLVFSLRRQNISDTGCGVYEEGTGRLTTGWLRTGRVRMDTTQPKIFYSLTLSAGGTAGTVATTHLDEADVSTALTTATFTGSLIQAREIAAAPTADASLWAQYKFTLNRTGGSAFRFSGYQLRVNPSQVKRRFIQVPLLCMAQETGPNGRTISRSVFDRVEALEKAEETGSPVIFQDFANNEERNVFIEEVQFISTHIPENYKQRSNAGGILLVTLRATDETDSTFVVPGSGFVSTKAATPHLLFKTDFQSSCIAKSGAGAAQVKAGTQVLVGSSLVNFAIATNITMPALVAGTDYFVYAKGDGTAEAVAATGTWPTPVASPPVNSQLIGGFHYAPGGNATGTSGGNTTPAINEYSVWDLKWRPSAADPRGMTLVADRFWADIYFLNNNPDANGTSRNNLPIADGATSGTTTPVIPAKFGGNGTTRYPAMTWWNTAECLSAYGKRMPTLAEAAVAFYGTTEAASRGGNRPISTGINTANNGTSNLDEKFTSKWGVIQATGCQWVWGDEFGGGTGTSSWNGNTGGRGSTFQQENAVLLGGRWDGGSLAGSRAAAWDNAPQNTGNYTAARGFCNHLMLI